MRKQAGLAAALVVLALGMGFGAKSGALSAPSPMPFFERWAAADAAQRSGKFLAYAP
jgi:hypothetical protein